MLVRVVRGGGGSDNVDKDFCIYKAFLRAVLAFLMYIW